MHTLVGDTNIILFVYVIKAENKDIKSILFWTRRSHSKCLSFIVLGDCAEFFFLCGSYQMESYLSILDAIGDGQKSIIFLNLYYPCAVVNIPYLCRKTFLTSYILSNWRNVWVLYCKILFCRRTLSPSPFCHRIEEIYRQRDRGSTTKACRYWSVPFHSPLPLYVILKKI